MKTKQETFDKVVRAIFAQGEPSVVAGVGCAYRSPDGCKCAAGHLIPDDKYEPYMEGATCFVQPGTPPLSGLNPRAVLVQDVLVAEGYDPRFVGELQIAHDQAAAEHEGDDAVFIGSFTFRARMLALAHGLSLEVFNTPAVIA